MGHNGPYHLRRPSGDCLFPACPISLLSSSQKLWHSYHEHQHRYEEHHGYGGVLQVSLADLGQPEDKKGQAHNGDD